VRKIRKEQQTKFSCATDSLEGKKYIHHVDGLTKGNYGPRACLKFIEIAPHMIQFRLSARRLALSLLKN